MIPTFPDFKNVTVDDKEAVESHTHKYAPYSDFNFTSLWAWDTNGERMISVLNDNLVVLFTDYDTYEPSLSFLGNNKTQETTEILIKFAESIGITNTLHYIGEESVKQQTNLNLRILEDTDNNDYICSVSELANLTGIKFKSKRHLSNKFIREYPDASFEIKDLNDPEVHKQILLVLQSWENKKKSDNKAYELKHEEIAIKRLLRDSHKHSLILSCVYLHGTLIGFSIDELLPLNYALSHFFKANTEYSGIYDYLNQKIAQYLCVKKIAFWNMEQDLGIVNLRRSKLSYRPTYFLKKYKISVNTQLALPIKSDEYLESISV